MSGSVKDVLRGSIGGIGKRIGSPGDILRLAETNSEIKYWVDLWQEGKMRWEEALAMMVVHLAHRCESFRQEAKLEQLKTRLESTDLVDKEGKKVRIVQDSPVVLEPVKPPNRPDAKCEPWHLEGGE
jgi:hypothetical protein